MAAHELRPPCWRKGFNEDDFNFSKLFKCVNSVGEHVMRNIVMAMYSHPSLNSDGGSKTLRQYLVDIGWSKRYMKDKITKLHVEFLDAKLNEAEFDISFACVIMTEACKDLWNKLSNTATAAVEDLNLMRNKICHKYGIDAAELGPLTDNLKRILKDICVGVGVVVGRDFSDDVNDMESAIQGIVSAQIQHIDTDTYYEDVKKFRKDLKFFMIHEGKKEFHSSYSKLQIRNPCIWMTEEDVENTTMSRYQVDTIFTPLKIEHNRQNIEIADIFTVTVKGSDQKPSALVVHGLAGCGKTSLCHYVIHEWCKNSNDRSVIGVDDFDLIIFVEIHRVRSKSLLAFLTDECMVQTCKGLQTDNIIPTLKDLNILVVIDGFDEAKKGISLELVNDIFCKFSGKRILVTTRPEYKEDVLCISRKFIVSSLQIQICGFDEKGLKIFSEKVFAAVEKDEQRRQRELCSFLRYMETTGKVLDEHLKLPLTLSLLIYLWREDNNIVFRIASATMLYQEIFKLCQKRLSERLEKQDRGKLEDKLSEVTFCLGQQAWLLLLEAEKEFDSIEKECLSRSVDIIYFLFIYLYSETGENEALQIRKFAFLHKTQMEYLAGAYLADSATVSSYKNPSLEEIDAEVEEKSEWREFQEVIKHITGSMAITQKLKEQEISHVFEILEEVNVPHDDFNFWWNFYLETLKNRSASRKIIDKLPLSEWSLDDKNVVSGLKFYRYLDAALETLKD